MSAALLGAESRPAYAQAGGGGSPGAQQPQAPPAGTGRAPSAWLVNGVGSVGQTLTGSLSIGGGRFERRPDTTLNPLLTPSDSAISYVNGGLFYGVDAGRSNLSAGFTAFGNYFPAFSDEILFGYSGSATASLAVTSRTTLTATQGAYLEPPLARSLQGIFGPGAGGGAIPPVLDPGRIEERALTLTTGVGLQHQLTSRSSLSLSYRRWRYDLRDQSLIQISDDASIRYTHALTGGLSFHAGYRYGTSRVEGVDVPPTERSGIDAGLDYGRALSLTRNTTLAFGAGTTVAREGDNNRFLLTGNVQLDHQIGRSWNTGVFYRRTADYVEGITGIVMTDGVGTFLGGQVGRRVSLSLQADASRGNIGLEDRNPFNSYRAGAGLSIAMSQSTGLGISYSYFQSDFDNGSFLLSPGLQKYQGHSTSVNVGWRYLQFGVAYSRYLYLSNRDQSLTASVSLFAPLVARTRRPDASR